MCKRGVQGILFNGGAIVLLLICIHIRRAGWRGQQTKDQLQQRR